MGVLLTPTNENMSVWPITAYTPVYAVGFPIPHNVELVPPKVFP